MMRFVASAVRTLEGATLEINVLTKECQLPEGS